MSVANVLAQVEAICKNISGVSASSGVGVAEQVPVLRAPVCYVEPQGPAMARATGGGVAGVVETRYAVVITLVLGGPEMTQKRALELAKPFFERVRDAFWADPTLGGACWKSELQGAATNLRGYRNKSAPSIRWRLLVWELTTGEGEAADLAAGLDAYIAIGEPGSETDISAACSGVSYDDSAAEHDTTPYGATAESAVPGLERGFVALSGKWDPATNALLAALRRVPARSIVLGPAGSAAGRPRISASGYLRDYSITSDAAGGPVSWRALFRATSAFVMDTF